MGVYRASAGAAVMIPVLLDTARRAKPVSGSVRAMLNFTPLFRGFDRSFTPGNDRFVLEKYVVSPRWAHGLADHSPGSSHSSIGSGSRGAVQMRLSAERG